MGHELKKLYYKAIWTLNIFKVTDKLARHFSNKYVYMFSDESSSSPYVQYTTGWSLCLGYHLTHIVTRQLWSCKTLFLQVLKQIGVKMFSSYSLASICRSLTVYSYKYRWSSSYDGKSVWLISVQSGVRTLSKSHVVSWSKKLLTLISTDWHMYWFELSLKKRNM